ncbi:MAG: S41 family peptidase [Cyclobacteriaceae bacterium]|nr:S41 family peptidase [Cyclobacteriaceae bacterium]
MRVLFIIFATALILIGPGCEEVFFEKDAANDPENSFDFLWTTLSERYSLFEFKQINWDSVYAVYRPRVNAGTSDAQLFEVMAEMLNTLKDGHVNLRSQFDISRYFPYLEVAPNFSFDLVERNYLGADYRFTGFLLNQVFDSVGYIYYGSFQSSVKDWELDTVINRFNHERVKGVIIDIRDNEGGNPENGLKLAARLIDQRTHIYTSQKKFGPGPADFAPAENIFLDPNTDSPHFPGQVIVLTNRKVYSAGSYFSASIKAIPDVMIVGDTTGGGSGVPAGFDLPNGWYCNYSSTIGTLTDGFNFEAGVPPDVYLQLDTVDILNGVDTYIEYAKTEILN